jgi:hypothetical protein
LHEELDFTHDFISLYPDQCLKSFVFGFREGEPEIRYLGKFVSMDYQSDFNGVESLGGSTPKLSAPKNGPLRSDKS